MIWFCQPVHYCPACLTRGQSQRSEWLVLLKQPYLHPRVHLDGGSAQWDAKWACLDSVVVVRCYPSAALRFSKQINTGYAVILQRSGNKERKYQQWPILVLKSFLATKPSKILTGWVLFFSALEKSGLNINKVISSISNISEGHVRWQ